MRRSLRAVAPVDDHGPSLALDDSAALLRRLELTVRHRLDGVLQGNYLGLVPGPGSEAGESRQYVVGDDVRRMDWPVTARTTIAHVRQTVADRELETWLVVDVSPSMDFDTGDTEKRELVLAAITALTHLTVRGGNRVGAIVANGAESYVVPARAGRDHARHLVARVAATPRAAQGGVRDLATALEQLRRPPRRRGLVAVISDFLDAAAPDVPVPAGDGAAPAWARPLRALRERHQLLGVEIVDPRELELPAAGLMTFADPESGRQLEVQTSDPGLRARYAAAAAEQRARIAGALARAGATRLQLRTDRDWVADVVRFATAQRQFVAGAVGGVR